MAKLAYSSTFEDLHGGEFTRLEFVEEQDQKDSTYIRAPEFDQYAEQGTEILRRP